jgi:protein-tyrosine phosphatase
VLAFIAAAAPEPLLFHCVAGKDRTGLLAALLLALADVRPDAIAHDYAVSAQMLREGYLRRYPDIDATRILEALRCPEEAAYNMLTFLEAAGGVHAYLVQIGLSPEQISRLRERLRS